MMKNSISLFLTMLLAVLLAEVPGQGREIFREEFEQFMRRSMEITKDTSYRTTVRIYQSDKPNGDWALYSSWIRESVFPDRSYLRYTSRTEQEILRIGTTGYIKGNDGRWLRSEGDRAELIASPAHVFGLGLTARYVVFEKDEAGVGEPTLILIHTKSKIVRDNGKDTNTYKYWFDNNGVLVKNESIAFNGSNWLQRIEAYEYDIRIRVEPPANQF